MNEENGLVVGELTEVEKKYQEINIDVSKIKDTSPFPVEVHQLAHSATPAKFIKKRPAKGGGEWDYVPTAYVIQQLNFMFGLVWSFVIESEKIESDEAVVKGYIEVPLPSGVTLKKYSYGNHEVAYKKIGNKVPLSIGNTYKAAASDCLKKCATQFGIALDLYSDEIMADRRLHASKSKEAKAKAKTAKDDLNNLTK